MCFLISSEVFGLQCLSEGYRLPKTKTQSLTRDCIDAPRGITNERHVPTITDEFSWYGSR